MIPPDANAAFVAAMEDVLETYQRPRDADRPLVCVDETSKQLIAETRAPIPAKPGQPARHDYEYERNGVANLFMIFAPLKPNFRRISRLIKSIVKSIETLNPFQWYRCCLQA